VNRTRNTEVNRFRNANEFRNRNNVAINRNRNFAVNRTGNAAYYRGGNARITNNWRGDAFGGQRYAAFRNYNRQWHDRNWWRSHYDRIVFVNNGWYYWNAGYWFPAWGYAPSVSYVYDGPIYGYNGLSPDQVTVNVQEQLARAGYYDGPIDGIDQRPQMSQTWKRWRDGWSNHCQRIRHDPPSFTEISNWTI